MTFYTTPNDTKPDTHLIERYKKAKLKVSTKKSDNDNNGGKNTDIFQSQTIRIDDIWPVGLFASKRRVSESLKRHFKMQKIFLISVSRKRTKNHKSFKWIAFVSFRSQSDVDAIIKIGKIYMPEQSSPCPAKIVPNSKSIYKNRLKLKDKTIKTDLPSTLPVSCKKCAYKTTSINRLLEHDKQNHLRKGYVPLNQPKCFIEGNRGQKRKWESEVNRYNTTPCDCVVNSRQPKCRQCFSYSEYCQYMSYDSYFSYYYQ